MIVRKKNSLSLFIIALCISLVVLIINFCIIVCQMALSPRTSPPPSIDLAMDIPNIKEGVTLPLEKLEMEIFFGLYIQKLNILTHTLVKCEFKSQHAEYTFFEINDLEEKDYSFTINEKNEIEYKNSRYIKMPSSLFIDEAGTCSIGFYFYGEETNYSSAGKAIWCEMTYKKDDKILFLKKE